VITKQVHRTGGLRDEELEIQVESEANQYIPFALERSTWEFQVVGPSPSGADEVEVLIAASRKEKVEDRVAVAEASGLKAIVMDVESTPSRLLRADSSSNSRITAKTRISRWSIWARTS